MARLFEQAPAPDKTVITAARNNFKWLRASDPHLWSRLLRAGVKLRTYPDFFHTRFLVADDDRLLVGSSNFSRQSFRCNQEVCLLISDAGFISDFKARMLAGVAPLDHTRNPPSAIASAMAAHFYFHGIVGAASLVAPFTPALSRR